MSDWPQMRLIRDFFRSDFSIFWLAEPKCTEIWSQKVPDLPHLGSIWHTLDPNLKSLGWGKNLPYQELPSDNSNGTEADALLKSLWENVIDIWWQFYTKNDNYWQGWMSFYEYVKMARYFQRKDKIGKW